MLNNLIGNLTLCGDQYVTLDTVCSSVVRDLSQRHRSI